MDRNLLQHGLEPFGVTETPLVDNLFSITRPDRPATTKPVASYLTEGMASTKPRGTLLHELPRKQQPQNRARGG